MPITLVAQAAAASASTNSVTTGAQNTTGASLIVLAVSSYNNAGVPTISDSKGNTWSHLTAQPVNVDVRLQLHYCLNPTVGSGHTFTSTLNGSYPSIMMQSFTHVRDYEGEDGNTTGSSVTSLTLGSAVEPGENLELVISALGCSGTSMAASGFSVVSQNYGAGLNFAGALGYQVQNAITAVQPNWTWTGASKAATALAFFLTSDTPRITSNGGGSTASVSIPENTTAVTTVVAESATTAIYEISGNVDASYFSINGDNGALVFTDPPDYEHPNDANADNIYEVQVTATDDFGTDTQDISVTVTDVADSAPSAAHFVVTRRKYQEE